MKCLLKELVMLQRLNHIAVEGKHQPWLRKREYLGHQQSSVGERKYSSLSALIRDQLAKIIQTTAITFNLTSDH